MAKRKGIASKGDTCWPSPPQNKKVAAALIFSEAKLRPMKKNVRETLSQAPDHVIIPSRSPSRSPNRFSTRSDTSMCSNTSKADSFASTKTSDSSTVKPSKAGVPPIYINGADWRKIATVIINADYYPTEGLEAKVAADDRILLQPSSPAVFRSIQSALR